VNETSIASWSLDLLAAAKLRLEALGLDLAAAPEEARKAAEATHAALMSGMGVRGATYLVILLFIGVAVEWLYWTYAYSPLRALQATPAHSPLEALRLGLRHLLLRASGVLLFTAAAIGASAAFNWPPRVHGLVISATLFLLVLRISWIAVSVVLSPQRPRLRLVPVASAKARWLAAALMGAIALLAMGSFLPPIVEGGAVPARHVASALRLAAYSAAALLLFVACFAFFGKPGRRAAGESGRAPMFPRSFPLALLVVAVYAVWLLNAGGAAAAATAAVTIALLLGLRDAVYFFWRSEADPAGERGALPAIALSLARFVVVLLGVGAAALALDTPLGALVESASPWVRIGLRLLGVAVLGLLAHGVWIAVRSVVDQRLARIAPADPHQPPDASSRLLTLLPLLRVTTAVSLLVLLVLTSLWALGIEITPLLAGAGVIGLRGRVPRRRIHRGRRQQQGHGRAHHAALGGAAPPQRAAAFRALRGAGQRAQYLTRLGHRQVQPASADRSRERADPQDDQEDRRRDEGGPRDRPADDRAAEGQALPHRPGREDLPLQVPQPAGEAVRRARERPETHRGGAEEVRYPVCRRQADRSHAAGAHLERRDS